MFLKPAKRILTLQYAESLEKDRVNYGSVWSAITQLQLSTKYQKIKDNVIQWVLLFFFSSRRFIRHEGETTLIWKFWFLFCKIFREWEIQTFVTSPEGITQWATFPTEGQVGTPVKLELIHTSLRIVCQSLQKVSGVTLGLIKPNDHFGKSQIP